MILHPSGWGTCVRVFPVGIFEGMFLDVEFSFWSVVWDEVVVVDTVASIFEVWGAFWSLLMVVRDVLMALRVCRNKQ